jgi:hypothetical protein
MKWKAPPNIADPPPHDNEPTPEEHYLYVLDDRVRPIASILRGKFRLSYKPDRVDLCFSPTSGDPHDADVVIWCKEVMRGLRSIMGHRSVYRRPYSFMQTYNGDWFCASLAPGDYKVEHKPGEDILFWYDDIGINHIDAPLFEPDYQHLIEIEPPKPVIPRKPILPPRRPVEVPAEPEPAAAPEMIKRRPIKLQRRPA